MPAPTACKRTVSGSLSLPFSGCFPPFPHGTGTLSVFRKYLALRHGRRGFRQDSSCPALLRWQSPTNALACTGLSPSADRLSRPVPVHAHATSTAPTTPDPPRRTRFGLLPFRSPLLWESIFLSSPGGTKMFQFPPFAPASSRCQTFSLAGYPIRTSPDHFTLADPRGFSQLATSFVASGSLGIPRSLLFSFSLSEPDGRRASRHGPRPLLLFLTRCL